MLVKSPSMIQAQLVDRHLSPTTTSRRTAVQPLSVRDKKETIHALELSVGMICCKQLRATCDSPRGSSWFLVRRTGSRQDLKQSSLPVNAGLRLERKNVGFDDQFSPAEKSLNNVSNCHYARLQAMVQYHVASVAKGHQMFRGTYWRRWTMLKRCKRIPRTALIQHEEISFVSRSNSSQAHHQPLSGH